MNDDWNYEESVRRVETIIKRIESGQLDLAQVFTEFSTAVEHLKECETFLQSRQQEINLLIETLEDP